MVGVFLDRRVNKGLLLERNQLQPRLSEKLICGRKQRGNTNLCSLATAVVGHGWLSSSSSFSTYWFLIILFLPPPPREAKRNRWSVVDRSLLLLSAIRVGVGVKNPGSVCSSISSFSLFFSSLRGLESSGHAGRFPLFLLPSLFRHIFESSSLLPLQWWWWWMTK